MKSIYIVILLSIFLSCDNKKTEVKYISLKGSIENYSGKVFLHHAFDKKYYVNKIIKDSSVSENGSFIFILPETQRTPAPYFILLEDGTPSSKFLLRPKDQEIIFDSIKYKMSPRILSDIIDNEQEIEYKRDIDTKLKDFTKSISIIRKQNIAESEINSKIINNRSLLKNELTFILEKYVEENPDSYYFFWEVVNDITFNGYSKTIEKAFNHFSDSIQGTPEGIVLKKDLEEVKLVGMGQIFPVLKLQDKNFNSFNFSTTDFNKSTYTLVDFWFSNCAPCIKEFPQFKELYNLYDRSQLNILGVSTDQTKHIKNWETIIKKYDLDWPQFLDENKIEASRLGIHKFPTNFLLNNQGEIINKDMSGKDLMIFLEENLK
jgi:thiol-disulfide isomerase/thioredoxin